MKIGLTYNLKEEWDFHDGEPPDANAEWDKPETVGMIAGAFQSAGHEVRRIGNVHKLMASLDRLDVDIVFNICEGDRGRNRESQVPLLLEMHGIPFVGSDALTLGMTLDKVFAKKCFVADGIPTPRFFVADDPKRAPGQNTIGYPLIVKTRYEGTSKGLSDDSRVGDAGELKRQVEMITRTYHQAALVEEFIRGTEFTVAVLGNRDPQAMPVVQVSIDGSTDLGDKFYTFERVFSTDLRYVCPARIPQALQKKIQTIAVEAYRSVDCRDLGRVDFRVDADGKPYVLEINPLPSLEKADVFNLFPQAVGSTYNETLNRILGHALERYGLTSLQEQESAVR